MAIRPAVAAFDPGIPAIGPVVHRPVGAVETVLDFLAGVAQPITHGLGFASDVGGGTASVILELGDRIGGAGRQ
jgi:hypothetical protein